MKLGVHLLVDKFNYIYIRVSSSYTSLYD